MIKIKNNYLNHVSSYMYVVCIAHEYLKCHYYTAFCEIFLSFSFFSKNPTGKRTHAPRLRIHMRMHTRTHAHVHTLPHEFRTCRNYIAFSGIFMSFSFFSDFLPDYFKNGNLNLGSPNSHTFEYYDIYT